MFYAAFKSTLRSMLLRL